MIYNNISASSGDVTFKAFKGLNRRIRTEAGEFSDMENLGHEEYPCLESVRGPQDMGFVLPDDAEAVKMIIPKRLDGEVTGFSGVVRQNNRYYMYINGIAKGDMMTKFTDAVDYNGSLICLPEFHGYAYCVEGKEEYEKNISPSTLSIPMKFRNLYDSYNKTETPQIYLSGTGIETVQKRFKAGDLISLSGLTGDYAKNNTIYPQSSTDYSNTTSPVSIEIKGIGGGASTTITVELKNCLGETIIWPTGYSDSTQEPTVGENGVIKKLVPMGTYACVAHNRVWVCSHTGEEVFCSALGKPLEFYEFAGVSTDSWSASVGTPGKFTGIAAWQNRVIAFKNDIIHVIYGDLPSTFGIEKTYAAGCIDSGSIASVGGMLIWLYYDGFYAYSGGMPKRISHKLAEKYVSCKAFSDGRRYFARCTKQDGTGEFLIYDAELGIWSKLSDIDIVGGDYFGGKLYAADKKRVWRLYGGEYGDFFAETPELTFDSFDDKSIIYANIRCKIDNGFLNLYTSTNNGEWVSHKGISTSGKHRLPIRYAPGDVIRIRLEGSGKVCIEEMKLEMLIKKR